MRRFWALSGVSLVSCLMLGSCRDEPTDAGPHVLLIVLDTTRADAVGADGGPDTRTPHLDALAREGLTFTQARSTSAWTIPSHGSIFTGLYPSNHGAHHEHPKLAAERETLAEVLSATHQTAGFSENSFIQDANGYAQGFDHFEDSWRERVGWSEPPDTIGQLGTWLSERDPRRPFFAFVNLMTPHLPYDPPRRFSEVFVPADTPANLEAQLRNLGDRAAQRYMSGTLELGQRALAVLHALYQADVSYADDQVGRIVALLKDHRVLDDTLVIVVGDHGENVGDHGLMEHQFSLHETLLRVPLILRLPGTVPAGERSDAPAQLIDLMPTVIDVTKVAHERVSRLDGQSLIGEGPPATRPVLAEFMRPEMQRKSYAALDPSFDFGPFDRRLKSLQVGALKLIASDDGTESLYDVKRDPMESRDLAAERPEELRRLRARLDAWIGESWQPGTRGELGGLDEDTLRELRALGYVQ